MSPKRSQCRLSGSGQSPRLPQDRRALRSVRSAAGLQTEPGAAAGGGSGVAGGGPRVLGDPALGGGRAEPPGHVRPQARCPGGVSRTVQADRDQRAGDRDQRAAPEPGPAGRAVRAGAQPVPQSQRALGGDEPDALGLRERGGEPVPGRVSRDRLGGRPAPGRPGARPAAVRRQQCVLRGRSGVPRPRLRAVLSTAATRTAGPSAWAT